MHGVVAEARPQAAYLDQAAPAVFLFHQNLPTSENITAKAASTMITIVIAATTELVVPAPRLSELGSIRRPKWQAISATSMPNTTLLPRPSHRLAIGTASGRRVRNRW